MNSNALIADPLAKPVLESEKKTSPQNELEKDLRPVEKVIATASAQEQPDQ